MKKQPTSQADSTMHIHNKTGDNMNSITDSLPTFDEIRVLSVTTSKTEPTENGYAAFVMDAMGVGVFNFCNTKEEWEQFMPTLVFTDCIGDELENVKDTDSFKEAINIYHSYSQPFPEWNLKDYHDFQSFSNKVLEDYCIEFVGPVTALFNGNNPFIKRVLEEFGEDPFKNKQTYFKFLQTYGF